MTTGIYGDHGYGRAGSLERWMAQQALREAERAGEAKSAGRPEKVTGAGKTEMSERVGETAGAEGAERVKNVENVRAASDKMPVPQDEYISRENSDREIKGIYRRGQDENGNPKILYDDPKKKEEKCTGDTNRVDREIRALKEKVKQLRQQIKAAAGDEGKVKELEQKLAQAEGELGRKDNDTYRKQNMDVVNG